MREATDRRTLAEQLLKHHGPMLGELYTLAWSGPLAHVARQWPQVAKAVADLQDRVPQHLPIWFFQGRGPQEADLIIAVPFADEAGQGPNVRLVPNRPLLPTEMSHFNHFSQAAWVAIEEGLLPPAHADAFKEALQPFTGSRLLHAE